MRTRWITAIASTAALTLLGGCYHAVARAGSRGLGDKETRTGWNLFWGIGDANFDVSDCPTGLSYVETWRPWWGFVPEMITFGLVSPYELTYACSAPVAQSQMQPQFGTPQQPAPIQPIYVAPPPYTAPQPAPLPPPPPPQRQEPPRVAPATAPVIERSNDDDDATPEPPIKKPVKKRPAKAKKTPR